MELNSASRKLDEVSACSSKKEIPVLNNESNLQEDDSLHGDKKQSHSYFGAMKMVQGKSTKTQAHEELYDQNMNVAESGAAEESNKSLSYVVKSNEEDLARSGMNCTEEKEAKSLTVQNEYPKYLFQYISHGNEDNKSVASVTDLRFYEELKRSLRISEKLKENNHRFQERKLELQAEVVEASKTVSRYETRSHFNSRRELQLRNDLNAALRKVQEEENRLAKYKRKIFLMEKLYEESEKRNKESERKFLEETKLAFEMKMEEMTKKEEEIKEKLDEREEGLAVLEEQLKVKERELADKEKEFDDRNEIQVSNDVDNVMLLENEELKRLVVALKLQQTEAKNLNERLIDQLRQNKAVADRLKDDKIVVEKRLQEQKLADKKRKDDKFFYQQKHREIQVQYERLVHELKAGQSEKRVLEMTVNSMKIELDKLRVSSGKTPPGTTIKEDQLGQMELATLRESLKSLEGEKVCLKKELQLKESLLMKRDFQSRNEAHEKEANEHHSSQHEEKINSMQQIVSRLELENQKLQKQIEAKKTESLENNSKENEDFHFRARIKELEEQNLLLKHEKERKLDEQIDSDFNALKEQNDKMSIEMALTRNNMIKLEADNNVLRQQVSQLKANIALGAEGVQHDDGGMLAGKYARGNFKIVRSPVGIREGESGRERAFTTDAIAPMDGDSYGKQLSLIEKGRGLSDSGKDEEKRAVHEKAERGSMRLKNGEQHQKPPTNPFQRLVSSDASKQTFSPRNNQSITSQGTSGSAFVNVSPRTSPNHADSNSTNSDRTNSNLKILSTSLMDPAADENRNQSTGGFAFQIPGALRASPAAKTFASFVFNRYETPSESEDDRVHQNEAESNEARQALRKTGKLSKGSRKQDLSCYSSDQVRFEKAGECKESMQDYEILHTDL
eukprot:gene11310-12492_t